MWQRETDCYLSIFSQAYDGYKDQDSLQLHMAMSQFWLNFWIESSSFREGRAFLPPSCLECGHGTLAILDQGRTREQEPGSLVYCMKQSHHTSPETSTSLLSCNRNKPLSCLSHQWFGSVTLAYCTVKGTSLQAMAKSSLPPGFANKVLLEQLH